MGLSNSSKNFIFLTVFNGKMACRVSEETEGAVMRKNKNGKIVHELLYDSLIGNLTGIEFKTGDYGKEIHLIISDGLDEYKLQMPFSSGVAKSFIMRLPNCDLTMPVEFCTGWDKVKERGFSYIRQNGTTIKSAYTKDEPNGMPQMVVIKVKGKDTWDDSDQLEFLERMLAKFIMPQFTNRSVNIPESLPPEDDNDFPQTPPDEKDSDDLLSNNQL